MLRTDEWETHQIPELSNNENKKLVKMQQVFKCKGSAKRLQVSEFSNKYCINQIHIASNIDIYF